MGTRYLGIDIGGTKISALALDESGKVLGRAKKKSRAERGAEVVVERAAEAARLACEDAKLPFEEVEVVGVGAPSPILPDGTAVAAPNMGWKNFPLTKKLSALLQKPVYAENDCNVGTYGEFTVGGHEDKKTLVGLFMGTGLGGGIIKDGKLVTGENFMAAEVGHMTIQVDGRLCGCGKRGCAEAYASKTGMGFAFREAVLLHQRPSALTELLEGASYDNVRSSLLKKGWEQKDEVTREVLSDAAKSLGVLAGNLITLLGPEVIVLGGGVMDALGDELLPLVKKSAKEQTFPQRSAEDTKLELATLGDDAVALGAMTYARDRHNLTSSSQA